MTSIVGRSEEGNMVTAIAADASVIEDHIRHVASSNPTLITSRLTDYLDPDETVPVVAPSDPTPLPGLRQIGHGGVPVYVADDSPDATHVLVRRDDLEACLDDVRLIERLPVHDRLHAVLDRRVTDSDQTEGEQK